jgi:signal transduction histidine kinase
MEVRANVQEEQQIATNRATAPQHSPLSIARRFLTHLGDAALPQNVVQLGCELLGADRGSLYLLDQQQKVTLIAQYPSHTDDLSSDALDEERLSWQTLHDFLPQLVDCDHDSEARFHYCHGGDCWLTLSIPLQWEGQNIAVVQLSYNPNASVNQNHMLGMIYEYAELAALALVQHWRYHHPAEQQTNQTAHSPLVHEYSFKSGVSLALAASEAERARIARDLHDGGRSALLGIQLYLEALRAALIQGDHQTAQEYLARTQTALNITEQELAHIVRDLYPPQLGEADFPTILTELGKRWSAVTKTQLHFTASPDLPTLDTNQLVALYRIVQEALANCHRHAQASQVTMSLVYDTDQLVLTIADNGRGGASLRGGGIGLLSMAQRAYAIGADFRLESPVGQGTRIVVTLPFKRETTAIHHCTGDCQHGADV